MHKNFSDHSRFPKPRQNAKTVPCFTPGTRIATPKGERVAESLTVGDRILTRDNGIQTITWAGWRPMSAQELRDNPALAPILISAGSLGDNLPERDMLVSPQHRMLVVSEIAREHFGEAEVLVAAADLTKLPGVKAVKVQQTAYVHFMCEKHQIVLADGTWAESFQPNDYAMKGVVAAQWEELLRLHPALATAEGRSAFGTARRALRRIESLVLFK